ncbi:MAG: methyltransferase domain-containing protein [Candidatus Woykebacteria bacterium]
MSIWEKTIFKGHSSYSGDVKVTENSGVRRLVAGGHTQSQTIKSNGRTGQGCWDDMVPEDLSLSADSRVLILGLGGGTSAKILSKKFGPLVIDGVDIDPLIVDIGRKYFYVNEPNLNVHIADAKEFVKGVRFKYDLICLDVFIAGKIPEDIERKEFLSDIKNILAPGGVLSINKIFSGKEEQNNFEDLVRSVFPVVASHVVRGDPRLDNVIVYARDL